MPPRSSTNPPPKTASAVAARLAFYCDLCSKGYARQNEFAAHEASYDHSHRKRLKELKEMNKSMDASASKARKAEDKASGLIKVNLGQASSAKKEGAGGGGFKKGGFKSAFAEKDELKVEETGKVVSAIKMEEMDSESEEEDYEVYDPRMPTGCTPDCPGLSQAT